MKVSNWKGINKGSLKGSFDLTLSLNKTHEGVELTVHECTLFEKNGRKWVGFPCRTYEKEGVTKYAPYMTMPKELKTQVETECIKLLAPLLQPPAVSTAADVPF
jgi:hypothetical protein